MMPSLRKKLKHRSGSSNDKQDTDSIHSEATGLGRSFLNSKIWGRTFHNEKSSLNERKASTQLDLGESGAPSASQSKQKLDSQVPDTDTQGSPTEARIIGNPDISNLTANVSEQSGSVISPGAGKDVEKRVCQKESSNVVGSAVSREHEIQPDQGSSYAGAITEHSVTNKTDEVAKPQREGLRNETSTTSVPLEESAPVSQLPQNASTFLNQSKSVEANTQPSFGPPHGIATPPAAQPTRKSTVKKGTLSDWTIYQCLLQEQSSGSNRQTTSKPLQDETKAETSVLLPSPIEIPAMEEHKAASPEKEEERSRLKIGGAFTAKIISGFMKNSKVQEVDAKDISTTDILIAVMGPTGSGKSSFINKATGFEGGVGHDLKSCTSKVTAIRFSLPEIADNDLVFVDTPGFDDTNLPDTKILEMISKWLNTTYGRGIRLNGLLYFHRISDNRMAGTPLKNLRLFEKICGDGFENVIMTTTMWDEVDEDEGNQREKELTEIYWKTLMKRGSQVRRFSHNQDSAFEVIGPIIDQANKEQTDRVQKDVENLGNALLLQKEVTDSSKDLGDTQAGKSLFMEFQRLVDKHQNMLGKIRSDLKDPQLSPDDLQLLMSDYQKVATELKNATEEMQSLAAKKGVGIGDDLRKVALTSRNFISFLQKFNIFRRFRNVPETHVQPI